MARKPTKPTPARAKISKTARASIGAKERGTHLKSCPVCRQPMYPLKVVKFLDMPGGMFWVCEKDNLRLPIR